MSLHSGRPTWLGLAATFAAAALVLTGCTPDGEAPPQATDSAPAGPVHLSLAVYGPGPLTTAYTRVARDFASEHHEVQVKVLTYRTHAQELAATRKSLAAGDGPDLFLINQPDLPGLRKRHLVQPVDALLGERHVDFGDEYPRNALEMFSQDTALQCMPTQLSPLVVYYNTRLVDLDKAQGPNGPQISAQTGWTFDEFERAARNAAKNGRKGVYVAPDLADVAPFVWSNGGEIVDNVGTPTTTHLSSGADATALQQLLELVRSPRVALSADQARGGKALALFEHGRLAMLPGFRDLTPVLRKARGLSFDVLPMPSFGHHATSGQVSAMCLSASSPHPTETADLLAYLVSDTAASTLALTGYVMPTNLTVTASDAFLQPGQMPESGSVFTDQVRNVQPLPIGGKWPAARAMVERRLQALFTQPVIDPLAGRLTTLDADSARILAPPSPSPSPSPSSTSTPSSTSSP